MGEAIEFSVVAPVFNEAKAAAALAREICTVLDGRSFEVIFVDDGSQDETRAELALLRPALPQLRLVAHRANAGQSRAVRSGVLAARAPIIATLDGDGQNDPADLPALLRQLTRPDAPARLAMVAGERQRRADQPHKRFASRWGNQLRRSLLRDAASDTGCGAKAFYRDAFLRLPYFDHMHRYLPALMLREGYQVEYAPVGHRPRLHGRSKYSNIGRLRASVRDILGMLWLQARARDPQGVDEL